MRRLAERAGVAVGTLYNQFGDRDGILVAFVSNGLDELERSLDDGAGVRTDRRDPACCSTGSTPRSPSAVDVWQPVFAVIKTSPGHAGLGAVGDRFEQARRARPGKAAAAGMFRVDIDVERLAWHIFMTRMARLERWSVGVIDWDEYRESSRLGLEISLAAVLVEPLATEALERSGLVR